MFVGTSLFLFSGQSNSSSWFQSFLEALKKTINSYYLTTKSIKLGKGYHTKPNFSILWEGKLIKVLKTKISFFSYREQTACISDFNYYLFCSVSWICRQVNLMAMLIKKVLLMTLYRLILLLTYLNNSGRLTGKTF